MDKVHTISMLLHVAFGSLWLGGGVLALATPKGSRRHVLGGKVFAWASLLVVLTALFAMLHEFLPLAVVLSLSTAYLVSSALLAFNRDFPHFRALNMLLMTLAVLLCAFALSQFVRLSFIRDQIAIGPLALTAMFGALAAQDWHMLRTHPEERNYWIRRHLTRMILAFAVAVMALLRIGVDFGIPFVATVVIPLGVAALCIGWTYQRYPVAAPITAKVVAP